MYKEVLFMKLKDLLLVADCNYHVFFKGLTDTLVTS